MDFEYSDKVQALRERLIAFMDENVYPIEKERDRFHADPANLWTRWPGTEAIKAKAKAAGLWNLFMPHEYGEWSPGLTNLEYAPLAELMGRVIGAAEYFNCSAPDTGNMEVLARYGTPAQKEQWLKPLHAGEIRSAYVMTEPGVASSDATNIETTIIADGDDYVVNGRKWWISGACDPNTKIHILLGRTPDPSRPRHQQHSQILIPADTPGIEIVRPLDVLHAVHSPGGHAEMTFTNVRVPKENLILGEGRGFEIAQGRLGPGRIHHCMRLIGQAQRALEYMARRVDSRVAFGRKLADQGSIRQDVALSFCEIEQARLLTLKAADAMDRHGNKVAKDLIAAIKIVAPRMTQRVADRAMQAHGGIGMARNVFAGMSLVTMQHFDPEQVLALIARYRIAGSVMVPTHFQRMLALPEAVRAKYDISSMQRLAHTGAACPRDVKQAMIEWFGPILVEAYGGTEAGSTTFITSPEWLARPGSVGKALPPFETEIYGEDGKRLGPGEVGQVYFRDTSGHGIVYRGDPEKTAAAHIAPGVFTLGEMGYMDEEGYLFITDRVSDMIVSGGVNIYPAEAEHVLLRHPKVADIAVVAAPNAEMGEEARALVIPADPNDPPTAEELNAFCRASLAGYKCPRGYTFVDDIGRTAMGKVNKKALRQRFWPTDRTIGG